MVGNSGKHTRMSRIKGKEHIASPYINIYGIGSFGGPKFDGPSFSISDQHLMEVLDSIHDSLTN